MTPEVLKLKQEAMRDRWAVIRKVAASNRVALDKHVRFRRCGPALSVEAKRRRDRVYRKSVKMAAEIASKVVNESLETGV